MGNQALTKICLLEDFETQKRNSANKLREIFRHGVRDPNARETRDTVGVLRFLRSEPVESADSRTSDRDGLDAFSSETTACAPASSSRVVDLRIVVAVLSAVVLLEAVPAALWLTDRLVADGEPETLPATVPTIALPAIIAAAPCEPAMPAEPRPAPAAVSAAAAVGSGSAARALVAGMLAATAPVPMKIYERGRLLGTTEAASTMVGAGVHDLEFVNESVGFRVRRMVSVQAGQTTSIRLDAPAGTLNVNAVPWAEVWIDNERVGETPIGNLRTTIGQHEVTFRHPEFGERRTTVLVTLTGPARISMDMRSK